MRFSLFFTAALIVAAGNAIDTENFNKPNIKYQDPKKFDWIEKPAGSGNWVKKDLKDDMKPLPLSRVQQLIKQNNEAIAANQAGKDKTAKQMAKLADNKKKNAFVQKPAAPAAAASGASAGAGANESDSDSSDEE